MNRCVLLFLSQLIGLVGELLSYELIVEMKPYLTVKRHAATARKKARKVEKSVRDCCGPVGEQSDPPETAGQVFGQFVKNTTLIGIPYILKKKSIAWLLAYIACMVLSIYQSLQSAETYIEQSSHERVSVEGVQLLPWPSITVCSNVVLQSPRDISHIEHGHVNLSSMNCEQQKNKTFVDQQIKLAKRKLAEYVRRNLTDEERRLRALSRDQWLKRCTFSYEPCDFSDKRLFYEFNSPYDGNCFTFNPAIVPGGGGGGGGIGLRKDIDSKLILDFKRVGTNVQMTGRVPFITVRIHSPGTTPLMDSPQSYDVYGGQNVNLALRLVKREFMLKARTEIASCVVDGPSGDKYRRQNFYYTDETPYRYSLDACMKTCFQKQLYGPCNLFDATFTMLRNRSYEDALELRIPPITACRLTENLQIGMKECKCPFPCSYFMYDTSLDTTNLEERKKERRCRKTLGKSNEERVNASYMRVSVQFLSNICSRHEETLDCDLTQFLGFLGGNISLWLGLCVLSLLELVQLVWDMIAVRWKNKWNKKKVAGHYPVYNQQIQHVQRFPFTYQYGGYPSWSTRKRAAVRRTRLFQ